MVDREQYTMAKLSGLQKQVLSLYRAFLRAARSKSPEDRRQIESIVAAEFRRNAKQIDRKNFIHIEYLLRRGNKQLDQLKSAATVRLSSLNLNSEPWNCMYISSILACCSSRFCFDPFWTLENKLRFICFLSSWILNHSFDLICLSCMILLLHCRSVGVGSRILQMLEHKENGFCSFVNLRYESSGVACLWLMTHPRTNIWILIFCKLYHHDNHSWPT